MNKKIDIAILIFLTFSILCFWQEVAVSAGNAKIYVTPGKPGYGPYYHIKYTLTPENTVMNMKRYYQGEPFDYASLKENGSFEIYIPKDKFPIPAPNSDGYLYLQMNGSEKPADATEKKALYYRIKKMVETKKGAVDVVIELNPYCIVKKKDPLEIELEGSNIYFRTAHGKYIDYVGPLKQ